MQEVGEAWGAFHWLTGEGLLVAVKNDPKQTFTRSSVTNKT